MGEVSSISDKSRRHLGERRDYEPRADLKPLEVRGEATQPIDHGVGFEGAVVIGQCHKGLGIKPQLKLLVERTGEGGVEKRSAPQFELEVATMASNCERAQQHRGPKLNTVVAPIGDPDAEMDAVDAPSGHQLEPLRCDGRRRDLRTAQRDLVANEVRQQGGLAGNELGKAARVSGRELDSSALRVDEVQQRRAPTQSRQLRAPLRPLLLGNVASSDPRLAKTEHVGASHLHRGRQVITFRLDQLRFDSEVVGGSIGTPHRATVGSRLHKSGENGPSFTNRAAVDLGLMDVLSGLALATVTLVVVVGGAVVAGFVVLFRRRGDRGIRRSTPSGIDALRRRAGTLLVKLDDMVRDADDEIGFALAQFGPEQAKPYAEALAAARAQVAEAFRLKHALDDVTPDSDRQQREWTLQIIALCEKAETALAGQDQAFSRLRSLEVNAAGTLDDVRRRIEATRARLAESRATLTKLAANYAETTFAAVVGNPDQAESQLAMATTAADAAAPAISATGVNAVASQLAEAAQAAHRADQLVDAVQRTARDLDAASAALAELRTRTRTDLTEANGELAKAPDADSGQGIIAAIADVEQALKVESKDPVADLDRIGDAVAGLDLALASARNQAQRLEHARRAYQGTLVSARTQIQTARDFIAGHGSGVDARTRLAEAERQLALAEVTADPVEALDTIRRAVTHAQDSDALARYDAMGRR